MDVTFNNVLEGKVRQYFLGVPKPAASEGAGQPVWPSEEGAPAQSGAPAASSRPPSAAAAPPASPPAPPPRPPTDPMEPEPHIIHKATVMREAAEKRRELPDLDDEEEPGGAQSPPSHIIHKPPRSQPSPAPCPSPARPSSEVPLPPPEQQEAAVQYRPPAHRVQTPTARPPDPYAPSRPPDPHSASRPPEQYGRYHYEASVADGGRTSNGPIASPQPSMPARHSPQTYARISSSIGSIPQHTASRLRENAAHSPPSQRYAMPPAQPIPPHNDRVPPIHHPQTTPPTQRLSSAEARSAHVYSPLQQRRETSPYARINSHYDRQPALPNRKHDPQQAYSGYRPSPTAPQILSNHRVDIMQQQIQYKQAAIDALTAEYSARVAERSAPSLAPPAPETVRIPPRVDYPSMTRTAIDVRSGYHYQTPSTSSRYASNVPVSTAPTSTLQSRTPYRMAAPQKVNYNYSSSPVQTSPARSTVKPGYPNQKAKPTVSVTTLYNEIKNKREPPAPANQSKQKRESPLDLSVKTVKNSADSSTTQDDAVDSASAESKMMPLQPRPSSITGRHPHIPAVGFAASHKVDFAPNFNQYGERSASQGYGSVPQQSHPSVRYNGAYDTRRPVPEAYTVESPHQVYQERSKYGIPVARAAFVPKIDLTRPVPDQRLPERIRDDRHFLIEERKRPAGPIVSNIPEKMVRYETWSSDSRIEQRMNQSAREQHELMNQPVYSYTSHKQLEAYQNEQKAKLFSSSSIYRQNHTQGPHRYPSNVYPTELPPRDVPTNDYHSHYPDRNLPMNSRHQVIQKIPSQMRERDAHLHHLDPQSRIPAKQSVLSILRNSLETKQTGFVDPTRSIKPDIIVIDDIDDPVIDITDLTKEIDHEASIKQCHNHLPGPDSPSFGNHIQMPKAIDSIPRDSDYQHIEKTEVKVKSPENDVASRIRTKAELKSMPPSQDNILKMETRQSLSLEEDKQTKLLPKSQKQHLFNQIREDLRLESVIKIEKPSETIIPEIKTEPMNIDEIERDAVVSIKTEDMSENFQPQCCEIPEDLDWASACDNFMEQLKTSNHKKKTPVKKRVDSLDIEKESQIDNSEKNESIEPTLQIPLPEIELPTISTIPTDVIIKQEPIDDVPNEDLPSSSSLAESEMQNLEIKLEEGKGIDPEITLIEKQLDSSTKYDTEKATKVKQIVRAKPDKTKPMASLSTSFKKETKENIDKIVREGKEIKGKVFKETKNNKEKKGSKDMVVKEIKENKEKAVIKTVIKEEQESTDDDEPLIKSKILKEKEESDRLKYQLLKDFTEKSAYVKLECCDVDVNKNNRKSLDSATKEKEDKPMKRKLSTQLSRSKTKSLSIDNNKNEKHDVDSSSESDDDLCVASRLRIRKSIKGEENKSTPSVKTPAKSSPTKKLDNSSASNSSTPVRKPGFGDGSDFHPGWEEELLRYKRSLRMPTRLIAIPRGRAGRPFMRGAGAFFSRGTTSLPDLDPVPLSPAPSSAPSAATDDLYARRPDKLTLDSDLDSNSSYSAPNRLQYDSEASTSTITSSTKKKKRSSIVDVLIKKCGRKEDSKRKTKDREEKTPKLIAKSSNTLELLPTPSLGLFKNNIKGNLVAQKEKLEEDIFYLGAFRKETITAHRHAFLNNTDGLLGAMEEFTPVVLKTRTRTESRIIRQRATIKEVFGDERPASAPPTSYRGVDYSNEKEDEIVVKKEPEETKPKSKPKKIIKGKILRRSSSIRDGLRSTKLLKRNDAKGRLMRIKKRNSIMLSMNNKRMKELSSNKTKNENSPTSNTDEKNKAKEENGSPVSVEGGTEVKKRFRRLFGRRKFSSGFDYIRKKKKIIRRDDQAAKARRPAAKPSPESVIDIQKEIKGWFINKSVGETHLHRAARLGYTDCVAYCLEKMEADPSAKDNAGFTPLHVASAKGHVRIARLLLQYGANVSAAAQGGIRPLHEASENCHVEVMRLLLSYGADPLLGTYAGQTPEELTEGPAAMLLQLHIADVQGRAVEPWPYPPPAVIIDKDELGCDPLSCPPPASPAPPPDTMMEIQCTEAPLPPFYSLKSAPGQPADGLWCLLQDITNFLQIKSKDSLLKQIHCGSGSPKELLREIRTQEFLERAQCNQLLGAGEKVNVRASKVALIRVTDKLRQLLKIETVLIS